MATSVLILLTGAEGQLATQLRMDSPSWATVVAPTSAELDIRDQSAVEAMCASVRPHVVINTAAYTAVDRAETEVELAFAVNRDGARHLAEAAKTIQSHFIQVSTDFVFDGRAGLPYSTSAIPRPISVYGQSKLEGELAVRAACPSAAIVRTAWLYSAHGNNFVRTMLRLMRERGRVRVVSDQMGSPTSSASLAKCLWTVAERRVVGTLHWTDAGAATWYDFAVAIAEEGVAAGLLDRLPVIDPIQTSDFPTAASRPSFSVLDKSGTWTRLELRAPHWREPLRATIEEIANGIAV